MKLFTANVTYFMDMGDDIPSKPSKETTIIAADSYGMAAEIIKECYRDDLISIDNFYECENPMFLSEFLLDKKLILGEENG